MKKILSISILLLTSIFSNAQTCDLIYELSPAKPTAEDEFTLTIDVTGTDLAGQTDLYIWSWSNAGDAFFNTAWDNSPEAAKLTHVSGNIFKITGSGVVWFQKTPGELTQFQFLIKKQNGSPQTCDVAPIKFEPLVFIPSKTRVFPATADIDDVVSVYFHQDLATNADEKRMTPKSAIIEVLDADGNTLTPATKEITLKNEGGNMWRASFKTNYHFSGGIPVKFKYRFKGVVRNAQNEEEEVMTDLEEFIYTTLKK